MRYINLKSCGASFYTSLMREWANAVKDGKSVVT